MRAAPSKMRLVSLSSRVSRVRAAGAALAVGAQGARLGAHSAGQRRAFQEKMTCIEHSRAGPSHAKWHGHVGSRACRRAPCLCAARRQVHATPALGAWRPRACASRLTRVAGTDADADTTPLTASLAAGGKLRGPRDARSRKLHDGRECAACIRPRLGAFMRYPRCFHA